MGPPGASVMGGDGRSSKGPQETRRASDRLDERRDRTVGSGTGTASSSRRVYSCCGSGEDLLDRPGLDQLTGSQHRDPIGDWCTTARSWLMNTQAKPSSRPAAPRRARAPRPGPRRRARSSARRRSAAAAAARAPVPARRVAADRRTAPGHAVERSRRAAAPRREGPARGLPGLAGVPPCGRRAARDMLCANGRSGSSDAAGSCCTNARSLRISRSRAAETLARSSSLDEDASGRDGHQACGGTAERGLARARLADQAQHLTRRRPPGERR